MNAKLIKALIMGATLTMHLPTFAGPGHDEDSNAPVAGGINKPQRLADGDVYMPKVAQRQLGVRTALAIQGSFSQTIELAGKIVPDPNLGGRVQAMVAGRISPPAQGFPVPGQKVKKGELLAYITPDVGPAGTRSLAESRLKRLQALSDTVPRKTLEEAQAAVANEELRAPVSGTIATTGIVAGQVVDARQLVFEVVNPDAFLVEATAYEPSIIDKIESANIAVNDQVIPLVFLGAAKSLREQALPVTFAAANAALSQLAIGQPVRVYVQMRQKQEGYKVPAGALVKNAANQTIVWVKENPIRFKPHPVVEMPLDGVFVLVNGLEPGDVVVSKSASLMNQVR